MIRSRSAADFNLKIQLGNYAVNYGNLIFEFISWSLLPLLGFKLVKEGSMITFISRRILHLVKYRWYLYYWDGFK